MSPIKQPSMTLTSAMLQGKRRFIVGMIPVFLTISAPSAAQSCNDAITKTAPMSRYTINAAMVTVTDNQTQLMWARCSQGQTFNVGTGGCEGSASELNWQGALASAAQSSLANYNDWRLPNIKELASLVEMACYSPAINEEVFPNTASSSFWSSSPSANHGDGAWGVSVGSGDDNTRNKGGGSHVRLVRGGQ